MAAQSQASPRERLFAGGIAVSFGLFIILLACSVVKTEQPAGHVPMWLGGIIGMAFFLAGCAMLLGGLGGEASADGTLSAATPMWLRVLQLVMVLGVVAALAALATWISIGPGERQFSASISGGAAGPANATLGRIVFGFGALLTWGMFILFAVKGAQKLRRGSAS
jgi:hypothetical protein